MSLLNLGVNGGIDNNGFLAGFGGGGCMVGSDVQCSCESASLMYGDGDGRMLALGFSWIWAFRVYLDLVFIASMWTVLIGPAHSWFRIWDHGDFCIKFGIRDRLCFSF